MQRFIVGVLLLGLIALAAFAALKPGEKAPDFSAKASLAGKEMNFSLKSALKKGPVVVYFYPIRVHRGLQHRSAHLRGEQGEIRRRRSLHYRSFP